jgi:hypothetical protein
VGLSTIFDLLPVLRFLDELIQRVRKPRLVARIYTTSKPDPNGSRQGLWALVFEVINTGEKPIVVVDNGIVAGDEVLEFGRMYGDVPKLPHNLQAGEIWSVWVPPGDSCTRLLNMGIDAAIQLKVRFVDASGRKYDSKACQITVGELAEYPRWDTG